MLEDYPSLLPARDALLICALLCSAILGCIGLPQGPYNGSKELLSWLTALCLLSLFGTWLFADRDDMQSGRFGEFAYVLPQFIGLWYCNIFLFWGLWTRYIQSTNNTSPKAEPARPINTHDPGSQPEDETLSAEYRAHPQYKDLGVTCGCPLRKDQGVCIICHDKLSVADRSLTHYKCEYSFHKGCLEEYHLYSNLTEIKCPHCQQILEERTRTKEEQKLGRLIRKLRLGRRDLLRRTQDGDGWVEGDNEILAQVQKCMASLEAREAKGLFKDVKMISAATNSAVATCPQSEAQIRVALCIDENIAYSELDVHNFVIL